MAKAKEEKPNDANTDPTVVKRWIKEIEAKDAEKVEAHSSYMGICSRIARDKKASLEAAKSAGLNMRALKAELKRRGYERKIANVVSDLEDDDRVSLADIRKSLGVLKGTPLGDAAEAKAKPEATSSANDDERDLRPPFLARKDGEPTDEEAGQANAEALKKGIRGMPGSGEGSV